MANYDNLKAAIQDAVYPNGEREVTAAMVQSILLQMTDSLGEGYQLMGVATPATPVPVTDSKVMYLAPSGSYLYFGKTVPAGSLGVLYYDGSWKLVTFPLVDDASVTTAKIADGAVTGAKVNDSALRPDDLSFDESHAIQLADREYNTLNPDGMGYVILRKGDTFATQVTQANTIYEIRYDFDLDGDEVTIPANCVLKFEGGSLSDGIIQGTNTFINSTNVCIFKDVKLTGTFSNDLSASWFEHASDLSISAKRTQRGIHVVGNVELDGTLLLYYNSVLYGDGTTASSLTLKTASPDTAIITLDTDISVNDLSIRGLKLKNNANSSVVYGVYRNGSTGSDGFSMMNNSFEDIFFIDIPAPIHITSFGFGVNVFRNCKFKGNSTGSHPAVYIHSNWNNQITFNNCQLRGNFSKGIEVNSLTELNNIYMSGWQIEDCVFTASRCFDFTATSSINNIVLKDSWIERLYLTTAKNSTIERLINVATSSSNSIRRVIINNNYFSSQFVGDVYFNASIIFFIDVQFNMASNPLNLRAESGHIDYILTYGMQGLGGIYEGNVDKATLLKKNYNPLQIIPVANKQSLVNIPYAANNTLAVLEDSGRVVRYNGSSWINLDGTALS